MEKNFFLLARIDPRPSCLTAQSRTRYSNLSLSHFIPTSLCYSCDFLSHFWFVRHNLILFFVLIYVFWACQSLTEIIQTSAINGSADQVTMIFRNMSVFLTSLFLRSFYFHNFFYAFVLWSVDLSNTYQWKTVYWQSISKQIRKLIFLLNKRGSIPGYIVCEVYPLPSTLCVFTNFLSQFLFVSKHLHALVCFVVHVLGLSILNWNCSNVCY